MVLRSLDQILEKASGNKPKKLVIAAAEELHVLLAVSQAIKKGIVSPIFIGDAGKIKNIANTINLDCNSYTCIDSPDFVEASKLAVSFIRNKKADILMKGMVSTSTLLKAVVNHESGIIKEGDLLSHIALCQVTSYHKILAITDAAMNIRPDITEKAEIIRNGVKLLNKLGYERPKVAVVCPVEKENPKIESTIHASELKIMNQKDQITNCLIDGPLALDNIISKDAAVIKGIDSEVAGDADLIVTTDLDSGNILYKSIIYLAGGTVAAIITGASVPIILTSRADSELSKLYSIALAACL